MRLILFSLGLLSLVASCTRPVCPPCPCGERDMATVKDLSSSSDLSCENRIGASCVDLPCCTPLQCVGGACASVTATR